jgi:hypothetical protein
VQQQQHKAGAKAQLFRGTLDEPETSIGFIQLLELLYALLV